MSQLKVPISFLEELSHSLEGEFYFDELFRTLYATDASVYREKPIGVAVPKNTTDLKKLIEFSRTHHLSLIPRAAGTSLAGQVVGNGIVVDITKHFNKILEFNKEEQWVRVQPGVVRDELNQYLKKHGLFFSPITSTANRAMIGGMVGNNSCGATSIVYGSTRDHVIELKTLLSDGSEVRFGSLSKQEFQQKTSLNTLEGDIYRNINNELNDPKVRSQIDKEFPKSTINRRNTGYAVDYLMNTSPFVETDT